ncbi:MAG: M20/M25/M40 family metallo-hydrolase, partial [Actinomycetota bacterium]|nr:M20/M25/M40 family metallo-hydrolase [Actinomycetota bacterium]
MSSVLDLLAALVRGRSVAEGEGELARRCAEVLEDAGLKPTLVPWRGVDGRLASGREQLVARSGDGATPLTLTGHLDTVPADAASWTSDPWSAERDGDRVLGRGTSDMKSGVAALVTA